VTLAAAVVTSAGVVILAGVAILAGAGAAISDNPIYLPNAEGVAKQSPGSRQRTLGSEATNIDANPEGVVEGPPVRVQPLRGWGWVGLGRSQGALARPWALLCTSFGVGNSLQGLSNA
jgi:hypothetical protein